MTLPSKRRLTFLKPSNPKRRKAKHDRNYGLNGRRGEAVRAMPCLCSSSAHRRSCDGATQAAHTTAKGMGAVKGDARDLVPLCGAHHRMAGEARTSQRRKFEEWVGLNLQAEADRIAAELDESLGPEPCYLCGETSGHSPMCKSVENRR